MKRGLIEMKTAINTPKTKTVNEIEHIEYEHCSVWTETMHTWDDYTGE